jgi:hypothetical protein
VASVGTLKYGLLLSLDLIAVWNVCKVSVFERSDDDYGSIVLSVDRAFHQSSCGNHSKRRGERKSRRETTFRSFRFFTYIYIYHDGSSEVRQSRIYVT